MSASQQINLYQAEFRIKRDKLTVAVMLKTLAIVLGLLTAASGWIFATNYRLGQQLEVLREELAIESRRTSEIDSLLAQRTQDRDLEMRLERAEQNLQSSRQMRELLSQTGLGNIDGFSETFKDLSRASIDGLWLTEIALTEGGEAVLLKGFTEDSAMVPTFVARLAQGKSTLMQRQFNVSTVRSSETGEGVFAFELRSSQ